MPHEQLTAGEAQKFLGISRQRLSQLVQEGKLKPSQEFRSAKGKILIRMFWRKDLVTRKEAVKKCQQS